MTQSSTKHLSLEIKYEILKVKKEFDEKVQAKDLEIQQMKNEFAEKLNTRDKEIGKVRLELGQGLKEKEKTIQVLKEKLQFAENKLRCVDEMKKEVQMSQTAIEALEKKLLTKLTATDKSFFDLKAELLTKQEIEKIKEQLRSEDPLKNWNRSLAEKNELNFDILTTPRCPYVWTFENFKEKFDASKISRLKDVIFSPYFFTEQGYKGCTRVWLQGTNHGKNTHISVFFWSKKGPYDEFLEWPIPFKSLTFTLIVNGVEIAKAVVRSTDDCGKWKDVLKKPNSYSTASLGHSLAFEHRLIEDINMGDIVAIQFEMKLLDSLNEGADKGDMMDGNSVW